MIRTQNGHVLDELISSWGHDNVERWAAWNGVRGDVRDRHDAYAAPIHEAARHLASFPNPPEAAVRSGEGNG